MENYLDLRHRFHLPHHSSCVCSNHPSPASWAILLLLRSDRSKTVSAEHSCDIYEVLISHIRSLCWSGMAAMSEKYPGLSGCAGIAPMMNMSACLRTNGTQCAGMVT